MKIHKLILSSLITSVVAAGVLHSVTGTSAQAATQSPSSGRGAYMEPKISHEQYGALKIVVPMTSDDKAIQGMKLRNIENSLNAVKKWGGEIQGSVVIYAKGISLLKNPDTETQKKIEALKAGGVRFVVCDNTLREQGIDFHKLYHVTEQDIVPSGFAEVAYLQTRESYVVDPIN